MLINDRTLGAGIKELKPGAAAPVVQSKILQQLSQLNKFSLRAVVASNLADHLVLDKDFTVFPLMGDFILAQHFVDAEKNL